ncbi:MAG: hypothetical protein U0360_05230 [Dehalococcoidia bacterium]
MLRLLASFPKAVAVAVGGLALAGGAVGAAASTGGTEIPRPVEAVLSALGFSDSGHHGDDDHRRATATGTARTGWKATATGTPRAASTEGLCNAVEHGSDQGREHKSDGFAFIRLKNAAAAAGQSIDDFCADHEHSNKHATPRATGTATAREKIEHGKPESDHSHGKSEEHRQGLGVTGGTITLAPPSDSHDDRDKKETGGKDAVTPRATPVGTSGNTSPANTESKGRGGGSGSRGENGGGGRGH